MQKFRLDRSPYGYTGQSLVDRGLSFQPSRLDAVTLSFEEEWVIFTTHIQNLTGCTIVDAKDAWIKLADTLHQRYKDEAEFSMALFNTLVGLVDAALDKDSVELGEPETAAIQSGNVPNERENALVDDSCQEDGKVEDDEDLLEARNRSEEGKGKPTKKLLLSGSIPSSKTIKVGFAVDRVRKEHSSVDKKIKADHVCMLFDAKENPIATLAVVKLRTDETTCSLCISDNEVEMPDQKDVNGGPIGQILCYDLRSVLPDLARNGIHVADIPWLVLACQIKPSRKRVKTENMSEVKTENVAEVTTENVSKVKTENVSEVHALNQVTGPLMFVFGSLSLPPMCGDELTYKISALGTFVENDATEGKVAKKAMAAYIHVLNFGLQSAIGRVAGISTSISGQDLYFAGTMVRDVKLLAAPYQRCTAGANKISIHQGELFSGSIEWDEINNNKPSYVEFVASMDSSTCMPVLFKVSSEIVHNVLIETHLAYEAIKAIVMKLKPDQAPYIFDVLLAAERPSEHSIITVMKDLSKISRPLHPKDYDDDKKTLWKLFEDMVLKTLLPMAKHCGVIFADLRVGWDQTFNVPVCSYCQPGSIEYRDELRLIDFESLTKRFNFQAQRNAFHMHHDGSTASYKSSSLKFVWWQCVLVAYCWRNKIPYASFSSRNTVVHLKKAFSASEWKGINTDQLRTLHTIATMVPSDVREEHIKETLTILEHGLENMTT